MSAVSSLNVRRQDDHTAAAEICRLERRPIGPTGPKVIWAVYMYTMRTNLYEGRPSALHLLRQEVVPPYGTPPVSVQLDIWSPDEKHWCRSHDRKEVYEEMNEAYARVDRFEYLVMNEVDDLGEDGSLIDGQHHLVLIEGDRRRLGGRAGYYSGRREECWYNG